MRTWCPLAAAQRIHCENGTACSVLAQDCAIWPARTSSGIQSAGFAHRSAAPGRFPGVPRSLHVDAALSRATSGVAGRTLIINLPGRPHAVRQNLNILMPVLSHALLGIEERIEEGVEGWG